MRVARHSGFSYVEVMVAAVIVGIALIPGMRALSSGVASAEAHVRLTEEHFHLSSRFEELLSLPLNDLEAEALSVASPTVATAYSDTPGTDRRRLVYLSRYDADNGDADGNRFTGGEAGVIWVRLELEGTPLHLETLTGPW